MEYIFLSVLTVCISCCLVIWLRNRPKTIIKEVKVPAVVPVQASPKTKVCEHKYQLMESLDHNRNNRCIGKVYISRCDHCGNIKKDHLELIK